MGWDGGESIGDGRGAMGKVKGRDRGWHRLKDLPDNDL